MGNGSNGRLRSPLGRRLTTALFPARARRLAARAGKRLAMFRALSSSLARYPEHHNFILDGPNGIVKLVI